MSRQRDFQRKKVYRAENFLAWEGKSLEDLDILRSWVNEKIVSSRWFQNRWPMDGVIIITDGRGRTRACGYRMTTKYRNYDTMTQSSPRGGKIKLPRWTRNRAAVLHELSHVIVGWHFPRGVPWHGREFCHVYLQLVKRWIGIDEWRQLRDSFKANGVKYTLNSHCPKD